jgi:predicted permease
LTTAVNDDDMKLIEIFATACSTTGSVLLIVAAGALIVQRMHDGGKHSLKGIVYVTALVTLPCLLFTSLAMGFDEALFMEAWPVLVFGAVQISFGLLMASVSSRIGFVDPAYAPLVTLALASQNAVAFPFALLAAIHNVWWFDGIGASRQNASESVDYGETLFFMFNICTSLVLWSIGNQTIARAAARREALLAGREPPPQDMFGGGTVREKAATFYQRTVKPALSIPVKASLLGIAVGLTPPLRWLVKEAPVTSTVTNGIKIAGDACIPLTLLALGCTLAVQQRNKTAPAAAATNVSSEAGVFGPAAVAVERGAETGMTPSAQGRQDQLRGTTSDTVVSTPHVPPPPRTPPLFMVPIEDNPSFDLRLVGHLSDESAETSGERPLAVSNASIAFHDLRRPEVLEALEPLTPAVPPSTPALQGVPPPPPPRSDEAAAAEEAVIGHHADLESLHTAEVATFWGPARKWNPQVRFVVYVVVVRLMLMPMLALGLCMIFLPPGSGSGSATADLSIEFVVDRRRVMILVILLESLAPSAVNGGVICTLHSYFPERYGQMLAVQYCCSVGASVVWLAAGLRFLG